MIRKENQIKYGSEFYNSSLKKQLKDNDINLYLTHNEKTSVVAERFFRTLKNKIYELMTSISKNISVNQRIQ